MSTTVIPQGGREIVDRMIAKFPELFVNEDAIQRVLTTRIAQQFAFVYGTQWGNKKRAGLSDDFKSKDSLAVLESDATISIWDMFSSGLDILVQDGQAPAFPNDSPANTTFMPVTPFNWLSGIVPGPDPEPEPEPEPGEDLTPRVEALEAEVAALRIELAVTQATQASHTARLDAIEDAPAPLLKVVGKTEAMWGHQHIVNLEVRPK